MKRLYNFDYLRGISAFFIMIYYFLYWEYGKFPFISLFARNALYGLSIFYIISGLTLFYVYENKMSSKSDLREFFRHRIFRVFPLFWLATIVSIFLSRQFPDV